MVFVGYLRVSTKMQGDSGLGLEAQREAINGIVASRGGTVAEWFTEVETGKRNDRPELEKALARAKRGKGTLVVAKLDRLSRNVAFLSATMESGVKFLCADQPNANEFLLHVLAAVAQAESKMISERTKAALAQAKKRGVKLGWARPGHCGGDESKRRKGLRKCWKLNTVLAQRAHAEVIPVIAGLRASGNTLQEVADRLNADGYTTRRGKLWSAVQVSRVLALGTMEEKLRRRGPLAALEV